jgi:hypothetical protein
MVLTERQQVARNFANELGKFEGVWVTSPLPLDESRKLNLQILDSERNHVLQIIRDWGWNPVCLSVLPRVHSTGWLAACLYEIDLPRERQPIPQEERAIPKDVLATPRAKTEVDIIVNEYFKVRK